MLNVIAVLISFSSILWGASIEDQGRRAISVLDYISRDYKNAVGDQGKIISDLEYQEMQDFVALVDKYAGPMRLISELKLQIQEKSSPAIIQKTTQTIRKDILTRFQVSTSPKDIPDLEQGRKIYAQSCAHCHGDKGHADTPTAQALTPRPSAFSDPELLNELSPFQAFNTLTYGVAGTGMPGFESFPEQDRWALAAYLFTLRADLPRDVIQDAPKLTWSEAIKMTDREVLAALTAKGILDNEKMAELSAIRHISKDSRAMAAGSAGFFTAEKSQKLMKESYQAYQSGKKQDSYDLAVSAYLDGFESLESLLASRGQSAIVANVEREFLKYRKYVQADNPKEVAASYERMNALLGDVKNSMAVENSSSGSSVLLGAFIIIFREGLEAILLVSIILTCLSTLKLQIFKKWVHVSWVLALLIGYLTWVLAESVISGGQREVMEGWLSLITAAVLIYVGFWILSKRDSKMWMEYLLGKLKGKNTAGVVTIFSVTFFAVYREVFETVLFMQTLKLNSQGHFTAIFLGVIIAIVSLLAISQMIFYFGRKLPFQTFFSVSGLLFYVLAIIFLGQGIHSLGEAGLLPLTQISNFTVTSLGLYPYLETLIPQLLLLLVFVAAQVGVRMRPDLFMNMAPKK